MDIVAAYELSKNLEDAGYLKSSNELARVAFFMQKWGEKALELDQKIEEAGLENLDAHDVAEAVWGDEPPAEEEDVAASLIAYLSVNGLPGADKVKS